MGLSCDSILRLMLQNGLDYELLEEETRDYVFYPAIHLLADSLPDNDDLMWAFLSLGESTTTRQAIQYVAISSSFVASGSGYHEKDDAAGKRDSELNLMRVSDIAEVEVKSIDGLELRGEYTGLLKVRLTSRLDRIQEGERSCQRSTPMSSSSQHSTSSTTE